MRDEYQRSAGEVVTALATDASSGLATRDARARLARFGPNELASERSVPAWQRLFRHGPAHETRQFHLRPVDEAPLAVDSVRCRKQKRIVDEHHGHARSEAARRSDSNAKSRAGRAEKSTGHRIDRNVTTQS